jgi:hypothetical protein
MAHFQHLAKEKVNFLQLSISLRLSFLQRQGIGKIMKKWGEGNNRKIRVE